MVTKIFIGNDRLDLYEDENIILKSSIADVSDISKNTTDYTQSFNVPASNINNNIFKHYYDANIDGGFDARVNVSGKIELDGIHFKYGEFRLNGVDIKNGQPSSYQLNFWGNLVSLKDTVKNDELSSLDLTAYDHEYNSDNVKEGLTNGLFNGDLIYTLFAKKQYYYNGNASDNVQTDSLTNIAQGGGANTGVVWSDLSPSLKAIRIIEAIENDYNLTFSRHFFGRTEFTNLFLYINNSTDLFYTSDLIDWNSENNDYIDFATDTGTYTMGSGYYWQLDVTIDSDVGFDSVPYIIVCEVNGEVFGESNTVTSTQTKAFIISPSEITTPTIEVKFYVKSIASINYIAAVRQRQRYALYSAVDVYTRGDGSILSTYSSANNMPKIKIIDFLKGLFKSFKLVIIPEDDGTLYVNTLDDYYADGKVINVTNFVDTNNYNVSRGKILNEIVFAFEEPQTILNIQFDKNTGDYFGDEDAYLYDDNGKLLEGSTYDYSIPFEQVLYERLNDINDNTGTNIQYASIVDEDTKAVTLKPHLFYGVKTSISAKPIGFINDVSVKESLSVNINMASYTEALDGTSKAFLFSEEFNTWNGLKLSNNLYTNYHKTYLDGVFNIKRRNYKYSAKDFPLTLLTELSLNDVLQIKDNYYRIDNYQLNLLTGSIDFNLINFINGTISDFYADRTNITVGYEEAQESIYVVGLSIATITKIDEGFGTSWCNVLHNGNNVTFYFEQNNTGALRTMTVNVEESSTLQNVDIKLVQTGNVVTLDNNIITLDSNIITLDNN